MFTKYSHVTRGTGREIHCAGSSETFCLEFHFSFTLCSETQRVRAGARALRAQQVSYLTSPVSHMTLPSLSYLGVMCHVIS